MTARAVLVVFQRTFLIVGRIAGLCRIMLVAGVFLGMHGDQHIAGI
jgi:hypothetical protein